MNCETCGNPIDRKDAERGSCGHCGAVLAHVLRAAEKAELVRRVVAQGNDVRIDGDSIEARAPPGPRREGPDGAILEARSMSFGVAAALGITLAAGLVAYVAIVHRSVPPTAPPLPTAAPKALIAEPVPPVAAPKPLPVERPAPMPTLAVKELEPPPKLRPRRARPPLPRRAPSRAWWRRTSPNTIAANALSSRATLPRRGAIRSPSPSIRKGGRSGSSF